MRLFGRAFGPRGDPARHLTREALRAGFAALARGPRDEGSVALIVCRGADGERTAPSAVRLTPAIGVPGDRWGLRPHRTNDAQVTVMRRDVAALVANGQPLTLFGDNLLVDLDISAANLPAGTRLTVGAALVEVTSKAHTGCSKFEQRFGRDALDFVEDPALRGERLRGLHWKVIEPGTVTIGAAVRVLQRSTTATASRRFRRATLADVPAMHALRLSVRENRLSNPGLITLGDYRTMVGRRGRGWVCEEAQRIVGFGIADPRSRNIWALFVAAGHERRGIGRELLDRMVAWLFEQSRQPIWLTTGANTRAEGFYRAAGWCHTSTEPSGELRLELTLDAYAAARFAARLEGSPARPRSER